MKIKNFTSFDTNDVEILSYDDFYHNILSLVELEDNHCISLFARPLSKRSLRLWAFVACDATADISVFVADINADTSLNSLTAECPAFHPFEREIYEQFGVNYSNHPWLKPLRFAHDRTIPLGIYDYPFYDIESEEFHRVGVGPIHAGIIEPGHFRFICEGEKIHHLEIQLGWQHRGVENVMLTKQNALARSLVAENIAGDSTVANAVAFTSLYESLAGYNADRSLNIDRTIALEQERIAVHTGDLSAICTDIAYQLGSAVFGRLRTPMINFFQKWSGSRFAKGLIRPSGTNFPFTDALADDWLTTISKFEPDFREMATEMFDLPSVLSRIERTGILSRETAIRIGLVGMVAKASGLSRDVRATHPTLLYPELQNKTIVLPQGDVYARAQVRYQEVLQSIQNIKQLITLRSSAPQVGWHDLSLQPTKTAVALVEGWRGMICHVAQTDNNGNLVAYKVTDPSVHNWLGLALAVRGNGISDFPICNKSFDLSYCGHDL